MVIQSAEAFEERYTLVAARHPRSDGLWPWGATLAVPANTVWTVTQANGERVIRAGYQPGVIGYAVTVQPWADKTEAYFLEEHVHTLTDHAIGFAGDPAREYPGAGTCFCGASVHVEEDEDGIVVVED